jgi:hypothetical protein
MHTTTRHPARRGRTAVILTFASLALTATLAACSTAGSTIPGTSVTLPSVNPSALASAGTQAAIDALDRIDTAITTNQSAAGLSADDAAALKALTASIRTALQTGDMTSARSKLDELSSKVSAMSATLTTDLGRQLTDAIAGLKAALGGG